MAMESRTARGQPGGGCELCGGRASVFRIVAEGPPPLSPRSVKAQGLCCSPDGSAGGALRLLDVAPPGRVQRILRMGTLVPWDRVHITPICAALSAADTRWDQRQIGG